MAKKSFLSELINGTLPFLLILLIPLTILFNFPALIGIYKDPTKSAVTPSNTVALSSNKDYKESTSVTTMTYLCSEVSYNQLNWIYNKTIGGYKNDEVPGWIHVSEGENPSGLEWALWVNQYNPNTYAIVYAATDQVKDTFRYIDMEVSEDYCDQMLEARDAIKSIPSIIQPLKEQNPNIYGDVEVLYITGHSLGGYLAMFIASEIVDSYYGSTFSDVRLSDISASLQLLNVHCITFGSPGMHYNEGFKLNGEEVPLTAWQQDKVNKNEAGLYNLIITNFMNTQDPVPNLLDKYLKHLGIVINLIANRSVANESWFFWTLEKLGTGIGIAATSASNIVASLGIASTENGLKGNVYYHMIWVYTSLLKGFA